MRERRVRQHWPWQRCLCAFPVPGRWANAEAAVAKRRHGSIRLRGVTGIGGMKTAISEIGTSRTVSAGRIRTAGSIKIEGERIRALRDGRRARRCNGRSARRNATHSATRKEIAGDSKTGQSTRGRGRDRRAIRALVRSGNPRHIPELARGLRGRSTDRRTGLLIRAETIRVRVPGLKCASPMSIPA